MKNNEPIQHYYLATGCYSTATCYRPAVLVDCKLVFRSLRASFHHNEERYFTAWYPESDLPVDWDQKAIELGIEQKLISTPAVDLPKRQGNWIFTKERLADMEEELISTLVRTEKLSVFYNPAFKLYSTPEETKEDFLERVSEKGIMDLEPEMRELTRMFEMKLEQVRESEERKGRKGELPNLDLLELLQKRSELFHIKSRISSIFLKSAHNNMKTRRTRHIEAATAIHPSSELHETLSLIEQEAADAVSELYSNFLERISQCDNFEVGLQRQNIQVLRKGVLWIPSPD